MKKPITIKHLVISNLIILIVIVSVFFSYQVAASPNNKPALQDISMDVLSYQGSLVDIRDTLVDGDLDMTFRIYNHPTDPAHLWEEVHSGVNAVPVQEGIFSVLLGSLNPIPGSIWAESELYLGIQIDSASEMVPRDLINLLPPQIATGSLNGNVLQPHSLGYQAFPSYWFNHGEPTGTIVFANKMTGVDTSWDVSGCAADNQWCCNSENNICIRKNPSGQDVLAFRMDKTHSHACWLVHDEDDYPIRSAGYAYATEANSGPFGTGIPAFFFMREGSNNIPVQQLASYFILCLNDAER